MGIGFLNEIRGKLHDMTTGADMYEIYIADPSTFSATTIGIGQDPNRKSPALYLFDVNGNGIIGNDNTASTGAQAFISDSSLTPGLYFIGIASSGHLPGSGKVEIFGDLTNTNNTSTPGTALEITKYIASSTTPNPADGGTDYEIDLTGADFAEAPEPGAAGLLGFGLVAIAWRLRQK